MKKFFILAVATLVAFSACTKIEDVDSAPAKKITFQAASYVPQTKATTNSSVWSEFTSFTCKAFLHAAGYTSEIQDMFTAAGETIKPWKSDGTSATSEADVSYWAPSHDYYWPKDASSYVNFVAWYDAKGTPTTATENSLVWTIDGSSRSLQTDDNILFADEAWRYNSNPTGNAPQYTGDAVTTGVPMIFHHALAQLCIKANVTKASEGNTSWDVTLTGIKLEGVFNKGTLTLENSAPSGTDPATKPWEGGWATSGTASTINMADMAATSKLPAVADNADKVLMSMQNIIPQTVTNNVVLSFYYNISYKYSGTEYAHEKIAASIQLNDTNKVSNAIGSWGMNEQITYTITINPETTTIKIDPAMVEWEPKNGGSASL